MSEPIKLLDYEHCAKIQRRALLVSFFIIHEPAYPAQRARSPFLYQAVYPDGSCQNSPTLKIKRVSVTDALWP